MARLSLRLCDIPKEGWKLDFAIEPDQLGLASEEGRIIGKLQFLADVIKTSDGASVEGILSGTIARECVRCLQEYTDDLSVQCTGRFHRPPDLDGRPHVSRSEDEDADEGCEDEAYACVGNHVELTEMIREHLILATPFQPLCHHDCLGLCQSCGQNLNHQRCECRDEKAVFGEFSQLQRVVKDSRYTSLR